MERSYAISEREVPGFNRHMHYYDLGQSFQKMAALLFFITGLSL
jgi:hypothetical protein